MFGDQARCIGHRFKTIGRQSSRSERGVREHSLGPDRMIRGAARLAANSTAREAIHDRPLLQNTDLRRGWPARLRHLSGRNCTTSGRSGYPLERCACPPGRLDLRVVRHWRAHRDAPWRSSIPGAFATRGATDSRTSPPAPASPRASVFGLASITKQFTAMSILLLARDHRLSLDDDVRTWVPEVPQLRRPDGQAHDSRAVASHQRHPQLSRAAGQRLGDHRPDDRSTACSNSSRASRSTSRRERSTATAIRDTCCSR